MRTLNVRLVAILLGSALAFAIAVFFVHRVQVRRNAHVFLQLADEGLQEAADARDREDLESEKKAYKKAVQNLGWYANLVPDDVNAVEKLGLLLADLGDYDDAYGTLEMVLRRDPTRMNVRQRLVEVAMLLGRYDSARTHLETYLLPSVPENGELQERLGVCQVRSGDNDDAVESFQRSIEESPWNVEAYAWLARILADRNRRLGPAHETDRLAQADACMKKLLESNGGSPSARLAYVEYASGLTLIRSIDDAWKHPLLLEAMIPSLLRGSVKHAVGRLDTADEADVRLLDAHREVLAKAVKQIVQTLRSDLKLDDPGSLLLAARSDVRPSKLPEDDVIHRVRDETLAALEAELPAEDNGVLQTATKHGVIVGSVKSLLTALASRDQMLRAAQIGILDDVDSQANEARVFLAADRATLAAAHKQGVLTAAVEQALASEEPDALQLTSKRQTVTKAVGHATEGVELPKDDADARSDAERHRVLVDAVYRAFSDRQLVADDRQRLLQVAQQENTMRRIIARTVRAQDADLEQADRVAILRLAQSSLRRSDPDQSRTYLQDGIAQYPDELRMYALLADIDAQAGRPDEAITGLRKGLRETDNHALLLWKLASLLIDSNEIAEAEQVIAQLVAAQHPAMGELPSSDVAGSFLRARLAHRQGQWKVASEELEQLRGRLTQWPNLLKQADAILSVCYAQLGDVDQQLAALRRVLDADPFHGPSLAAMADGLARTGKAEESLQFYRRLATLDPTGILPLARTLLQANLRRPAAERDWREIEGLLKSAEAVDPNSVPLTILRAEVLLAQNRAPEAVDTLDDAWQKQPDNTTLWNTLIALHQQLEDWDRVEELLQAADGKIEDQVARLLVRVQYETTRYRDEASKYLDAALQEVATLPESDRQRALMGLLTVAVRANVEAQSRQICQQIAVLDPTNIHIRFLQFQLTIGTRDEAALQKALDEIEKIEGKGPYWLYGSAVILSLPVENGADERLDRALKLLAQARRARPTWGQVYLLEAGIYDQKGNRDLALQNYMRAIDLGDGNSKAYRRAVDLLTIAGRHAEAETVMNRLLQQETVLSQEDLRRQGVVDWGQGDLDSALQAARDVAKDSQRYQDHIWLGRLLAQRAQVAREESQTAQSQQMTTEAEQAFLHAAELDDTAAATWVSLIYFYSVNGETEKAEAALAQAETKIPADEAPLAMAQIYEAMGQAGKAQKHYEDAVNVTPDDIEVVQRLVDFYLRAGKAEQAEPQLKRIISGKLKADQDVVAWARRRQAQVLATQSGYRNLQQAIALVEQNLSTSDSSAEDTVLLATLLARSPSREQQDRAVASLEALPAPSADDRFALARLYFARGNSAKGEALLRSLLANFGNQPQYLATYVDALLKQDRLGSDVDSYLKSLERLAPNRFEVVNLRADFLFRQKKFLPALNLMTGFLSRSDAVPADEGQRLALVATRLEQFVRRLNDSASKASTPEEREAFEAMADRYASESERLYRAYVADRPSVRMLLAAFLGRQGKIEEAMQLLEQVWSDGPPEAVAQVSVILMKSPKATAEQLARGDKVVQASLKKFAKSTPLQLAAADIRSFQGRYQESEAIYRAILRADPQNVIAKNNLAVLLALQKIKLSEAVKLIDEAIASAGPLGSMLDSRATVHMALGHPEKALDDLKEAIAQEASPVRLFHRAQALLQAGQRAEAVRTWKQAQDAGLDSELIQNLEQPAYAKLKKELQSG